MRIKYKKSGHPSRDEARMSVTGGGTRLAYLPSAAAIEVIAKWPHGADMEWEVDDATLQPVSIHLTPAPDNGIPLKLRDGQRPNFNFSTAAVGAAVPDHARAAEEVEVSASRITVQIPFKFARDEGA